MQIIRLCSQRFRFGKSGVRTKNFPFEWAPEILLSSEEAWLPFKTPAFFFLQDLSSATKMKPHSETKTSCLIAILSPRTHLMQSYNPLIYRTHYQPTFIENLLYTQRSTGQVVPRTLCSLVFEMSLWGLYYYSPISWGGGLKLTGVITWSNISLF